MKKIISLLAVFCLIFSLFACTNSKETAADSANSTETTKLSFKAATSYSSLKKMNGQSVTIDGYLATSSPADGSFIFLMNLPYQSCPFCKPNTSQLSNTLECYPKEGKTFDYTNQAVRVSGRLEVCEDEDEPFTDLYGYEFSFKIVDASYKIIKSEDLSEEMQLYQKLAQTDVINDVYEMFNYVSFLVSWPTYSVKSYTDENGNTVKGYYLYASDAMNHLTRDDGQYKYGTEEGYFENIIKTVESVDATAFADLVSCIKQAQTLADKAYADLKNGKYTSEYQYIDKFDTSDYVYTLDNGDAMADEFNNIYEDFSSWLAAWEM